MASDHVVEVRFLSGAQRKIASQSRCEFISNLNQMFTVYLLESIKTKKWYIGFTPSSVFERLKKHNYGEVLSTKTYLPWRVIYFECYLNRSDATGREKFLKSGAGWKFLKKQLKNYLIGLPRVNAVSFTRVTSSTGRATPS